MLTLSVKIMDDIISFHSVSFSIQNIINIYRASRKPATKNIKMGLNGNKFKDTIINMAQAHYLCKQDKWIFMGKIFFLADYPICTQNYDIHKKHHNSMTVNSCEKNNIFASLTDKYIFK